MKRQELRKLQQIWTQKLRDSGFVDIEYSNGQIKKESNLRFKSEGYKQAIRDRLSWIGERYVDNTQLSVVEEQILEYHCDGLAQTEIADQLNVSLDKVKNTIRKARAAYRQHCDSLRKRK